MSTRYGTGGPMAAVMSLTRPKLGDDVYTTADLEDVLYAPVLAPEAVGFWLKWFPKVITSDRQEILFDAVNLNERRLAPFVAPNVQGRVMREKGYETRTFVPAYVKPKHVVEPSRAIPRQPGERLYGALSLAQRRDAVIADNMRRERIMCENRWDWMAARAIIDGAVTVTGDDYPTTTIDFRRDASLTITLTGSALWTASTAAPMTDIENARAQSFLLSSAPVTDLIFGIQAWKAFNLLSHTDVQNLLQVLRRGSTSDFNQTGTRSGAAAEYQGQISSSTGGARLALWVYSNTYEDVDGSIQSYMDPTYVVGLGNAVEGAQAFGAIMDHESLVATPMFPKMWRQEDPSVTYTMIQSAPLMVPGRPNNTFRMKVC